jgi:hypothetical protein
MTADILISKTFYEHPFADEIECKVRQAIVFFPELTGDITLVRFGHSKIGSKWAVAYADYAKKEIGFNVKWNISMQTIFHELGHFLQRSIKEIPSGEQACSIYALARMPEELVDDCVIPYIGCVPESKIPYYCQLGLKLRNENKERRYIKKLVEIIKIDSESFPERVKTGEVKFKELSNEEYRKFQLELNETD